MAKWFKKNAQRLKVTDGDRETRRRRLKPETKHGLSVLFLFTLSFVLLLSLAGLAGPLGERLHDALRQGFGGVVGWTIPFGLLALALALTRAEFRWRGHHWLGLIMVTLGVTGLFQAGHYQAAAWQLVTRGEGGGFLGYVAFMPLYQIFSLWPSVLWLAALTIGGVLVLFETSLKNVLSPILSLSKILGSLLAWRQSSKQPIINTMASAEAGQAAAEKELAARLTVKKLTNLIPSFTTRSSTTSVPKQEPLLKVPTTKPRIDIPIELLKNSSSQPQAGDIKGRMATIKQTLFNFGLVVEMGEVSVGPTVTQYTLKPAEGVKLSQITGLANDLALALAAHPIRIEAPIPGKALVGIEVPNATVATVALRDILTSEAFRQRHSNLTLSLGKDVAGRPWVADLETMPHLLIAGATGSGKSVCINSMLVSLLYTNSPDDLKFIIIDPKRVELGTYNQVPHLLTPVITEIDKTISALKWVVAEMDRRYQTLAQAGKRNIQAFRQSDGEMPYIVVVIDELADLMAVAAHEVESAIIRLAQMARAVGIHLLVATQRPSVDVITGLIKANITHRLAFAVASSTDSRTILDSGGAEKLLGRGDSLYFSPQLSKPKRLQCALVSDEEIERIVSWLYHQQKPVFNTEVVAKRSGVGGGWSGEGDDLFDQAKAVVVRAGKASASLLQRRLRVGYARAARLLDLLEAAGIIGPGEGAKPREVLLDQESFEAQIVANWPASVTQEAEPTDELWSGTDREGSIEEGAEADDQEEEIEERLR